MQYKNQGWKKTLLFLLVFALTGCSGSREVYLTGGALEPVSETAQESAVESADPDAAGNSRSEDAQEQGAADTDAVQKPAGYVYVCGAVMQPGVYQIHEGMRVFEAIALAGGFSQEADQQWLNQAEPLRDGQRLYVCTQEETQQLREASGGTVASGVFPADTGDGSDASGDRKVNLNTADRETLKTLPGIGDAKADAILRYREEHGSFSSIEEIQNISGIKSAIFSRIEDLITV